MKYLLLGKTGQVGQSLTRSLPVLGEVVALGRSELNALHLNTIEDCLQSIKPDVIINAVAYTAVDRAESEPLLAQCINADFVDKLASYAKKYGVLLIHYSTDYVFDGEKQSAYVEADLTNPLNIYGLTKRAGELAVQSSGCRAFILRTSWVYALHGRNFINTILDLAQKRNELSVVADQWGAPTSAAFISTITIAVIRAYLQGQLGEGLAHLSASGSTTWHALAHYCISKALNLGMPLQLHPEHIIAITTAQYPLPAKRPLNSKLDTHYLSQCLKQSFPHWQQDIDHLLLQRSMLQETV